MTSREFIDLEHRGGEQAYACKHPLTQDVAYSGLLTSRRRELHRKGGSRAGALLRGPARGGPRPPGYHFSEARAHREAVHLELLKRA